MSAVITAAQHAAVLDEIEGGARPTWSREASPSSGGGYYIQPTVFAGVDPDARLAQHEIFGPVLSVIRAGTSTMPSTSPTGPSTA